MDMDESRAGQANQIRYIPRVKCNNTTCPESRNSVYCCSHFTPGLNLVINAGGKKALSTLQHDDGFLSFSVEVVVATALDPFSVSTHTGRSFNCRPDSSILNTQLSFDIKSLSVKIFFN